VERRRGTVTVADTKSTATDIVTAVDRESEDLIRARVLAARPHDSFLGEEGDDIHGTSGVRWVVDPIDGTVNYLYDIPTYAVSVAVERDGRTVAGVVVDAPRGEIFTGSLGGGAFLTGGRSASPAARTWPGPWSAPASGTTPSGARCRPRWCST
jgi:myo-inositol-1(or 4)-monophosphatase